MPKRQRQQAQTSQGVLDREGHVEAERRRTYLGSARVDLVKLKFDREPQHQPSPANVRRLVAAFENAGCSRLPSHHHVPAVIGRQMLDEARVSSMLSPEDLLRPDVSHCPLLTFADGVHVDCLHGRHRIAAALEHLPVSEQWWVVDFYSSDLSAELRASLVEQNTNEQIPSVGEVFFRILDCDPMDSASRGFWWSQIHSPNEKVELRRLTQRPSLNQAFREVARFPAFGRQVLPGNVGEILRLKCDEEVIHGLRHISQSWSTIFTGVSTAEHRLDPETVQQMEQKSVKHCRADRDSLDPMVRRGLIFSSFSSHERDIIWRNLLDYSGRIPSLTVFFEDFKHLQDLGRCVKSLFQLSRHQTLSQALRQSFVSQPNQASCRDHQYNLARRRLFLFVTQHLRSLRPSSILLGGETERAITETSARTMRGLAEEAHRLGFRSSKIDQELAKNPDRIEARRSLLGARDPKEFIYDPGQIESCIDEMVAIYARARRIVSDAGPPVYVIDDEEGQAAASRVGRPVQRDLVACAPFLTLENMHVDASWGLGQLTPLFIRRDVYLSFFGPLEQSLSILSSATTNTTETQMAEPETRPRVAPDVDLDMPDVEEDHEVGDDDPVTNGALVLVRPKLWTPDSASQYSQSLDDDIVLNATNRGVGAAALVNSTARDYEDMSISTDSQSPPPAAMDDPTTVPEVVSSSGHITLIVYTESDLKRSDRIQIDGRSPSAVEEVVAGYMDRSIYPFDVTFHALALEQCFDAALADPDHTLFLMPRLHVTMSTAQMLAHGVRKRRASNEIHARPHKRVNVEP